MGEGGEEAAAAAMASSLGETGEVERSAGKDDRVVEEEVMSEVHLGCPPRFSGPFVSHFTFSLPSSPDDIVGRHNGLLEAGREGQAHGLDEDGDLVLPRRKKTFNVAIQHRITSTLPDVGLQVWKAALVLADFVLHVSIISSDFDDITALELGAGTACSKLKLLFMSKYTWTSSEIEEAERVSLLLAADVIYSDDLTDSFFSVVESLMSRGAEKVLYLALEKRYNFSLDDLDVVANGYLHFRSFFRDEEECSRLGDASFPCFVGKQIDIAQIPQYIRGYERVRDLEIWKINYVPVRNAI